MQTLDSSFVQPIIELSVCSLINAILDMFMCILIEQKEAHCDAFNARQKTSFPQRRSGVKC